MNRKETVLVSLCWTGEPCRYHGRPVRSLAKIARLSARYEVIYVCPERLAGLPVPRPAAPLKNLKDGRLLDVTGRDVTAAFELGARRALAIARRHRIRRAYLVRGSPSCDSSGFTGSLLKEHGIQVVNL